jgi:hypothetical protein
MHGNLSNRRVATVKTSGTELAPAIAGMTATSGVLATSGRQSTTRTSNATNSKVDGKSLDRDASSKVDASNRRDASNSSRNIRNPINLILSDLLHCKRRLAIFPSPAGLTKLSLGGNNLIIPGQEEFG